MTIPVFSNQFFCMFGQAVFFADWCPTLKATVTASPRPSRGNLNLSTAFTLLLKFRTWFAWWMQGLFCFCWFWRGFWSDPSCPNADRPENRGVFTFPLKESAFDQGFLRPPWNLPFLPLKNRVYITLISVFRGKQAILKVDIRSKPHNFIFFAKDQNKATWVPFMCPQKNDSDLVMSNPWFFFRSFFFSLVSLKIMFWCLCRNKNRVRSTWLVTGFVWVVNKIMVFLSVS